MEFLDVLMPGHLSNVVWEVPWHRLYWLWRLDAGADLVDIIYVCMKLEISQAGWIRPLFASCGGLDDNAEIFSEAGPRPDTDVGYWIHA